MDLELPRTYPDFTIESFLQRVKLLIVGIVVNSLASVSYGRVRETNPHRTLSNLEVWLTAKDAVIPIPDLGTDQ
jgi:hypothetical protein